MLAQHMNKLIAFVILNNYKYLTQEEFINRLKRNKITYKLVTTKTGRPLWIEHNLTKN